MYSHRPMKIKVSYLDNLKNEAYFDDFKVMSDQPIRYNGDGLAPGPFDYFLASSAMCAAYFVKVYCLAREIPTEDISISQNNIIDPENRYKQTFEINVSLPDEISEKDRKGIISSIERCSVKRVIQNNPEFKINAISTSSAEKTLRLEDYIRESEVTHIAGKDSSLEKSLLKFNSLLEQIGIEIEIASWRNPIPHVWSVHIRDAECPMNYTNGKGTTQLAALCSALGEFFERLSCNYFYADYYLGKEIAERPFVHYPNERWFPLTSSFPGNLMDEYLLSIYSLEGELRPEHLIDTNSGNRARGVCALPFIRQSDGEEIFVPVNLIGNLFVSNGMSAGNTMSEAKVQALSEIFERYVKNKVIKEEMALPDVPADIIAKYPQLLEGMAKLEEAGFPVFVKDSSLGGLFPVVCVAILNKKTGGAFLSFGAHPLFEVAFERSLTELLQGRSFEGLNIVPPPTFNSAAVTEPNNLVEHFIDSTGVVSWKFFNNRSNYKFIEWDFKGTTEEEFIYLINILNQLEKEVYIAEYTHLGIPACRILVPDLSEVYEKEDLIWDNNNLALLFREDILSIHQLDENKKRALLERFDEYQIDDYKLISELIGVSFEEHTPWGGLTVLELKTLLYFSLNELEDTKAGIDMLLTFNAVVRDRQKLFQLLNVLVDIELEEDQEQNNLRETLIRLYGEDLYTYGLEIISNKVSFPGLHETDLNLSGFDKHQRLIRSYIKLFP